MPQSTKNTHLIFQYFRIDRKKIGNGTDVKLNTNFGFLNIFNSQRFAPDEPSSFSSLEYVFLKKDISKKMGLYISGGIYRNHIKGDFLLPEYTVHFGRGNSQVGLSASSYIFTRVLKKMAASFSFQLGAGSHFTKLTANENKVSPNSWGIRGWGISSNMGLWLDSPVFFKRFAIGIGPVFNFTYSSYADFEIENAATGVVSTYKNAHFSAISKQPKWTVLFKYFFS